MVIVLSQYTHRPLTTSLLVSMCLVRGIPLTPKNHQENIGVFMTDIKEKEVKKIRNKSVKIRLFESELSELNSLKVGNELATWMRETCLNKKSKRRNEPVDVDPLLLRQLAAVGNNVNQLARLANASGMPAIDSVEIITVLHEIKAELEAIRGQNAS